MSDSPAIPAPLVPFGIVGFPCSGMDWCARLLAMHPQIAVVDAVDELGPIGGKGWSEGRQLVPVGDLAARVQAALAKKPAATHVGVVGVEGALGGVAGERIVVLRDGRDVLVHWTLRQLRDHGPVLARFLAEPGDGRMPEVAARFAVDADAVWTRERWRLLCDYEWVRYGAHLWQRAVTGHVEALAWSSDHGGQTGRDPFTLQFEAARADAREPFAAMVQWLGLDPAVVPPFATPDPVLAGEPDSRRLAEWEVAVWHRYFTPRASKLWKMDGQHGLDSLAGCTADDEWVGDCAPEPK